MISNETFTMTSLFYLFCVTIGLTLGKEGFGPTDQEWGYVTVRDSAHMFWWLHTTFHDKPYEQPLIIWLQGGPGASSTEYGNFEEIGPWDSDLKPRNTTWLKNYNLLFVDNPVGTGFSYVDKRQYFATTNEQIAKDFLVLMQGFLEAVPKFKNSTFYIFSESYGGKMAAEIALHLDNATKKGNLSATLGGIGLGDSWISPIDSCLTWASYLKSTSFIDQNGYDAIQSVALKIQKALNNKQYSKATDLWSTEEYVVYEHAADVDFYNILTKISAEEYSRKGLSRTSLKAQDLMEKVAKKLNITQKFGEQSDDVFEFLGGDFMKPVINIVESVLNTTNITVAVYNGQLDLIVDTPGTIQWIDKMRWNDIKGWKAINRKPFDVNGYHEGFEKKYKNFKLYWILRSGHMTPIDNPAAMEYILRDVIES